MTGWGWALKAEVEPLDIGGPTGRVRRAEPISEGPPGAALRPEESFLHTQTIAPSKCASGHISIRPTFFL